MAARKRDGAATGYKIGGISDFLSVGKDEKVTFGSSKELGNLFSGNLSDLPPLISEDVSETNHVDDHETGPTARPSTRSEEYVDEPDTFEIQETGKKRKRIEKNLTSESTRKEQRDNRKKSKLTEDNKKTAGDTPERLARTIFVGNIPVSSTRKELKLFFVKYGKIESIRLRSVPVAKPELSKKLAVLKKEFHPERNSMNAYVVFEEKSYAEKALASKGTEFKGMHMRVSLASKKEIDNKSSVFVGNLPFNAQEEDIRELFNQCGDVKDVRVIRDKKTGIGKGFGYVTFKESDSVTFATKLKNTELNGRKIRVFRSVDKDDTKKPFNKKKDRQFRMKDVASKNKHGPGGTGKKIASREGKNTFGHVKANKKKGSKDFSKHSTKSKFSMKKNKQKFSKKK